MQRGELLLTIALVALILAGITYEELRGADKNAEVIITHSGTTPFDAQKTSQVLSNSIVSPTASPQFAKSASEGTIPTPPSGNTSSLLAYINRATQADLEKLPGIGEVMAQRILIKRNEIGHFDRIEQLQSVSGIGKAKLEGLLEAMNHIFLSPTRVPPRILPAMPPVPPRETPSFIRPAPTRSGMKASTRSLNEATREQLMEIPGIGEKTADAILKARTDQGGFRTWSDVEKVSGIGKHRLQVLQETFTLTPLRK